MTVADLVAGERRRLRLRLLVAGGALAAAGAAALAAAGGLALGGARWLALPRALPWLVWA
ncbi:MAG: hypothetical protein JO180_12605, partial [Gemmatirosa sp.]|nr:hypothetical protein [Gemmatirosa sp.]